VIRPAASYLQQKLAQWPPTTIVLGSAQAHFTEAIENPLVLNFGEIPGWPVPRIEGHAGKLIAGTVNGVPLSVLAGRVHLYEGWTPQDVTFGVRVLGLLGTKRLILTNAAGGINPSYHPGLLVAITDHINLQGANPLVGPNDDTVGPRFPDMSRAYCPELRAKAKATASALGIELGEGVYAGMLGPSFETPAEIRYLRTIGADLAGMSTVPECIAANHLGMKVLGLSTVTNMAAGMQAELSHHEVLEVGSAAAGDLIRLLTAILTTLEA
jgi:purine-nucleoside phosphorylase